MVIMLICLHYKVTLSLQFFRDLKKHRKRQVFNRPDNLHKTATSNMHLRQPATVLSKIKAMTLIPS